MAGTFQQLLDRKGISADDPLRQQEQLIAEAGINPEIAVANRLDQIRASQRQPAPRPVKKAGIFEKLGIPTGGLNPRGVLSDKQKRDRPLETEALRQEQDNEFRRLLIRGQ